MPDANFKPGTRADVIRDSISPLGARLTTIEVTFHRFVLAEFNTHRVFSRNSASSRAIPFSKQVARVMESPAIPVEFPREQRGMQGGDLLEGDELFDAQEEWLRARSSAVQHATVLADMGVHKSVVNRLLEPFMWHTVIVTATDWQGFWDQRVSPLAQPEIRVAAEAMLYDAYEKSEPTLVQHGEWHLPYIDGYDVEEARSRFEPHEVTENLKRICCARCARVSYLTHDGKRDFDKDLELFWRLVKATPMHASPLEHVATPVRDIDIRPKGNFRGWAQFRHPIEAQKALVAAGDGEW